MTDSNSIPIIWEDKKDHHTTYFTQGAYTILETFSERFNQHYPVRQIEVHVNIARYPNNKLKYYEIKIHVMLKNGRLIIGHSQTKNILIGIREAIKRIKHEAEKINQS